MQSIAFGTTVVIDRYYYSGCVYSAAKRNPSLDLEWARKPEEGLPRPDVCIFLDISPEDAAKRGGYGSEQYEKKEMQGNVRQLFNELRLSKDGNDFATIYGGQNVDLVSKQVLETVEVTMQEVDHGSLPLRYIEPW